jgi:hypothetical protein
MQRRSAMPQVLVLDYEESAAGVRGGDLEQQIADAHGMLFPEAVLAGGE